MLYKSKAPKDLDYMVKNRCTIKCRNVAAMIVQIMFRIAETYFCVLLTLALHLLKAFLYGTL